MDSNQEPPIKGRQSIKPGIRLGLKILTYKTSIWYCYYNGCTLINGLA